MNAESAICEYARDLAHDSDEGYYEDEVCERKVQGAVEICEQMGLLGNIQYFDMYDYALDQYYKTKNNRWTRRADED